MKRAIFYGLKSSSKGSTACAKKSNLPFFIIFKYVWREEYNPIRKIQDPLDVLKKIKQEDFHFRSNLVTLNPIEVQFNTI